MAGRPLRRARALLNNPADDLHGRLAAYERIAAPNSGATPNEKAMAARLAAGIREKLGIRAGSPHPAPPPPPHTTSPPPSPPPRARSVGDETVERIRREHNRSWDLSKLDLGGLDFSGADLKGFHFSESNLVGANLKRGCEERVCRILENTFISRSLWIKTQFFR